MSRRRLGRVNNDNHARCMRENAWKSNIAIKKKGVCYCLQKRGVECHFSLKIGRLYLIFTYK
jgi:hypothetical protein